MVVACSPSLRRLAFVLAAVRARDDDGAAERGALRDASIALGRFHADGVCGGRAPRKRVAFLVSGLVRTLGRPHVYGTIASRAVDAMGVDAELFLELKTAGSGRVGVERGAVSPAIEAAVAHLRPTSVARPARAIFHRKETRLRRSSARRRAGTGREASSRRRSGRNAKGGSRPKTRRATGSRRSGSRRAARSSRWSRASARAPSRSTPSSSSAPTTTGSARRPPGARWRASGRATRRTRTSRARTTRGTRAASTGGSPRRAARRPRSSCRPSAT
mmetsp:Transcript_21717/g.68066  ORF Transcript_21717/g.68066 Transcript_21717/m.68066 type:complete len:275 (-) Transcript_21717:241-1065(-)